MEIIITAVGPDHKGLADPIVHHVTEIGANISEIQMFDHREEAIFAMMLRMDWDIQSNDEAIEKLRGVMTQIAANKELSIRVWSPDERADKPNIAICVTHRLEPPLAILHAIKSGELKSDEIHSDQDQGEKIESGELKSDEIKSDEIRSAEIKSEK